jgi:undecaprenyl-diphosphatase
VIFGLTDNFDSEIMEKLIPPQTPSFKLFFTVISQLGTPAVLIFSPIVVLWYILRKNNRKGYFIITVMVGAFILRNVLKILIARPRPELSSAAIDSYSYPSGHVLDGLCFYLALAITINESIDNKYKRVIVWVISVVLVALISISRIYLRVHYPTDVIGSIFLGVLWLLTVHQYFDKIEVFFKRIETLLGRALKNKATND